MSVEHQDLIVPTSIEDRTRIKIMIGQAVDCAIRAKAENDTKKGLIEQISADYNIPKKLIAKAVQIAFKENFQTVKNENEDLETLIDTLKIADGVGGVKHYDDNE